MGKKKRGRGHYCWICGKRKSNESFSSKGHRNHICKKCVALNPEQRKALEERVEKAEIRRPLEGEGPYGKKNRPDPDISECFSDDIPCGDAFDWDAEADDPMDDGAGDAGNGLEEGELSF